MGPFLWVRPVEQRTSLWLPGGIPDSYGRTFLRRLRASLPLLIEMTKTRQVDGKERTPNFVLSSDYLSKMYPITCIFTPPDDGELPNQ